MLNTLIAALDKVQLNIAKFCIATCTCDHGTGIEAFPLSYSSSDVYYRYCIRLAKVVQRQEQARTRKLDFHCWLFCMFTHWLPVFPVWLGAWYNLVHGFSEGTSSTTSSLLGNMSYIECLYVFLQWDAVLACRDMPCGRSPKASKVSSSDCIHDRVLTWFVSVWIILKKVMIMLYHHMSFRII